MELRRHLLIAALLAGTASATSVRTYPLDERAVTTISIGTSEPTTCVFPGPLSALEAANVSAKAEDNAPVLLAYQPGTNYFTVRALKADAKGAVNVVLRGQIFPLRFTASETPDRVVTFLEEPARPQSTEALRNLLERARHFQNAITQYPSVEFAIEVAHPNATTVYRDFTVTLEDVFRFDAEDAIVCCVRFDNPATKSTAYAPNGLGVRAGRETFVAAIVDASGAIPPRGSARGWFVIASDRSGARLNLPVTASLSVIVPQ